MNSFKQKIKGVFSLLKSDRFMLISTEYENKKYPDYGEIFVMTKNNMTDHDVLFFCTEYAEEAEENIRIEEAMEMSDILGKQMCGMINEINLN